MKLGYLLGMLTVSAGLVGAAIGADDKNEAKPKWTGTIKVQGKHTQAELKQMAKITAKEATKTALAAVQGQNKKVTEVELEVEHGYLVYGVEIKVNGQKAEYEVLVDAGNGKVLDTELEEDDDD